jgi:type VI secretion system protein ImpI/type VI secretion system protein
MSVTLRFQSSGAVPGDGRPVVMRGANLTIGRGPDNDLVLPDPDRQISKTHCVIENHSGNVVVVDLSANGTFLNYGKTALGRTPTPLNDGDVLIVGAYELVVQVSAQSYEPAAPLGEERASFGDAALAPDPMRLLDDAGPGGDFLDSLLGSDKLKGPAQFRGKQDDIAELLPPLGDDGPLLGSAPSPPPGPAMRNHGSSGSDAYRPPAAARPAIPDDWDDLLAPAPPPLPPPPPPPAAAPVPSSPAVASDAARAFLAALGAADLAVTDAELPETMGRLGRTLKSMITGLREILLTRSSIKSELRIEQTMVNVGGNNPLKFSVSPEQAVEAMVKPTVRGYLPAEKAAEQALEDIKAHEIAMVTGMEAALKGMLARLNPAQLTKKIEAKGGFGGLFANRKAQYWETYEAIYAEISDQAENDFHELFAREFAKAYKDQLARLKAEARARSKD